MLGKPARGFFNRETLEVEQLLAATRREGRFTLVKRVSLFMFTLGAVAALLLNNPSLIPVLGAGFAFTPVWYLRSTAAAYKKHLNEELETAISVITTSYLRNRDLPKAVKENIPYLNPPVKSHFEAFITESEMLNANMVSTINTLTFTVQKFSDQRIIQSELEAIISKITLAICCSTVLFSFTRIMQLSKPIEYKANHKGR